MNIAVNTRFLLKDKLEGIGIYTHELFSRVVQLMPEHQFYFYFDRPFDKQFIYSGNVHPRILFPQARHPLLWYWWFEKSIPKRLKQDKIDLFISPDGYCSLNTGIPQVMTVHDLAFEHYPQFIPFTVARFYKKFVPQYCKKATKLWAVSEYTRLDIENHYKINTHKIDVIYNAVDTSLFNTRQTAFHQSNAIKAPYFIFLGAIHPRKNVLNLLKAFNAFKQEQANNFKLLLIGRNAWLNQELKNYLMSMPFHSDVIWIENCTRDDLANYLKNAFSMVYPSLFEGFGIPVIEAMQCGVPVACSNTSCLPEIAQDAAIYFNPENVDDIKKAMLRLSKDEMLRSQLSEKGRQRAANFSWDASAQKMADSIRSILLG